MSSNTTNETDDGMLYSDSPSVDEVSVYEETSRGGGVGGVVLKKGPWTSAEDAILIEYVKQHGEGNWNAVQKHSGLLRCGKSCRLRWANHLRPNLKKGAFTPEEERLIVELHAKMGNKWARMAAHLPGRTDNEIKNYWNTRIKRRQRAGLSLYPHELMSGQVLQDNQHSQNQLDIHGFDSMNHDILQTSGYSLPDFSLDNLDASQEVLPFMPEYADISTNISLFNGLVSPEFYSLSPTFHYHKRLRELGPLSGYNSYSVTEASGIDKARTGNLETKVPQSLGLCFPYEPDPIANKLLPFCDNQGNYCPLNNNFSTLKPGTGALKLELPSLQYPETQLGGWVSPPMLPELEALDSFIMSSTPGPVQSDCSSAQDSGLLESLVYGVSTCRSSEHQPFEKSSNCSTGVLGGIRNSSSINKCSTDVKICDPLVNSIASASTFGHCCPINATGSSLEEDEAFPGCKLEPVDHYNILDGEKKGSTSNPLDYSRPDAILASCWFEQRPYSSFNEQDRATDATTAIHGDKLSNDNKNMATKTSASNSVCGFGSCSWNNMPPVCQMPEFP